jgi:hypothetical protein
MTQAKRIIDETDWEEDSSCFERKFQQRRYFREERSRAHSENGKFKIPHKFGTNDQD